MRNCSTGSTMTKPEFADQGERLRLRRDFAYYAQTCLKIRPKDPRDGLQPLLLNPPQIYVHERLEQQKASTGRVRALILKGRQEGISTYVGARFYHRTAN